LQQLLQLIKSECLEEVDASWPPAVLAWIGRTDLFANALGGSLVPHSGAVVSASMNSGGDAMGSKDEQLSRKAIIDEDANGLKALEASSLQRFPEDMRMREVCRMLCSSKPLYLKVDRSAEVSEVEHRAKLLERLSWLLRRSFAYSVGRGMLTIATAEPLMAEKLPIPPLSTQGRVPPLNSILAAENLGESMIWPSFHNGVAAALRVGPRIQETLRHHHMQQSSQRKQSSEAFLQRLQSARSVTRNWIMYNKTAAYAADDDDSHAGFLMGLGLFGHLNVLTITDICDYLTHSHESTTIAILIGVSISKMASGDALISKTLFLHLPSLIPTPHWGIDISPTVQCSALVGIGFLFARSCSRLMIQFLIEELFRKPSSDRCECRESLSICASWALAMIALPRLFTSRNTKKGDITSKMSSIHDELADMKIEDRLFHLIEGGKRPSDMTVFANGPSSMSAMFGAADPNAKNSRILEGDLLNTDVTAPGATLALGLLYQRSQNDKILRRLEFPNTVLELDSIRADQLFYRSLARALIQWDAVQPTMSWLNAQLPSILSNARQEHLAELKKSMHSTISSADGDKGEGDENRMPPSKKYVGPYGGSRRNQAKLDRKVTLSLIINIYAGYAQGLGLIYAGTFDERVKTLLLEQLRWLQSIRENKNKEMNCSDKIAKYTVEMATCATCLALACVMAGSGDIACLRVFRELRWRIDAEQSYGSHMAYSMAIGMLFLGGGKFSLKRDPVSIACLVLSILPRYPNRVTDQQAHLQALRHLYVLAVEPRVLQTVDVATGIPVSVDLELELTNGEVITTCAPGLLPELQSIRRISVKNEQQRHHSQFFPCSMDLQYFIGRQCHHGRGPPNSSNSNASNSSPNASQYQRPLSSPGSPWKAWADTEHAHAEMAMMQHCTMLPPLYVKVKSSSNVILANALVVKDNRAQDEDAGSYCDKYDDQENKRTLSQLLKHIFIHGEDTTERNILASLDHPTEETIEAVCAATHASLMKELWQFPSVQQTLLGALNK
jgi:anaphase-promoting complex subunit 1